MAKSGIEETSSTYVLSGIIFGTPIEVTPEPSKSDVSSIPSMSNHHHWSVTEFVPKDYSVDYRAAKNLFEQKKKSSSKKYDQIRKLFDDMHNLINIATSINQQFEKQINFEEKNDNIETKDIKIKQTYSKTSNIKELEIPAEKLYQNNVIISISGMAKNEKEEISSSYVLSGIILGTPIEITPEPSKCNVTSIRSLSNYYHSNGKEIVPENHYDLQKLSNIPAFSNQLLLNQQINNEKNNNIANEQIEMKQIQGTKKKNKIKYRHKDVIRHVKKEIQQRKKKPKQHETAKTTLNENEDNKYFKSNKSNPQEGDKSIVEENDTSIVAKRENKSITENDNKSIEKKKDEIISQKDDKINTNNLSALMKTALEEMAEEGYILAKLPACHEMPPLKVWIMYRKGFKITDKKISDQLKETQKFWDAADNDSTNKKIKAPELKLIDEKSALTYASYFTLKKKGEINKKKFYSDVRKHRVLQARTMWNSIEKAQYPHVSVNFKKTYFVYQSSKEADGWFLKPYGLKSE